MEFFNTCLKPKKIPRFRDLRKASRWCLDSLNSLLAPRWPEGHTLEAPGRPELCPLCCPTGDPKDEIEWPEDIRDQNFLEKDRHEYSVKLENVRPEHFKKVGRNLLNLAYEDPSYQSDAEEDKMEVDLLPPPPDASDAVKAMDEPLISVNLKGLGWPEVEQLGEIFYETADMYEDYEQGKEIWQPGEEIVPKDEEAMEEYFFDGEKKLEAEITERHKLSNSDLIPGLKPEPYRADIDEWVHRVCGDDCDRDFNFTPYSNLAYAPYFKERVYEPLPD